MKKIAFLMFVLFCQTIFAQSINASLSGTTTVEIGIPYSYSVTYSTASPNGYGNFVLTSYEITTFNNPWNGSIPGTLNNQTDQTVTTTNPNFQVYWGNYYDSPSDAIQVKITGYFVSNSGGSNYNYNETKIFNITKLTITNPVISGPNTLPKCCTSNQTYTVSAGSANSFTWSATGGATFPNGNTGSSVVVTPPVNGDYTLSVIAKRTTSNPAYQRTGTKTTTRTDRSITFTPSYPNGNTYGFDYICKGVGRVMQLENQCGISTINWVAPNCTISGQGTTNPTITPNSTVANGGSVSIYAVVTFTGGCTATTPTKSFTVYEGTTTPTPDGTIKLTYDKRWPYIVTGTYIPSNPYSNGITITGEPLAFDLLQNQHYEDVTIINTNLCTGLSSSKIFHILIPAYMPPTGGGGGGQPQLKMAQSITISPNPNIGEFTVTFPQEISGEYFVFDLNGTQIKQGKINKSKSENVKLQNNLRQGNYIIKVITDDKKEFSQNILIK